MYVRNFVLSKVNIYFKISKIPFTRKSFEDLSHFQYEGFENGFRYIEFLTKLHFKNKLFSNEYNLFIACFFL